MEAVGLVGVVGRKGRWATAVSRESEVTRGEAPTDPSEASTGHDGTG